MRGSDALWRRRFISTKNTRSGVRKSDGSIATAWDRVLI